MAAAAYQGGRLSHNFQNAAQTLALHAIATDMCMILQNSSNGQSG